MTSDGRFRFHVAPTSGVPIYRQLIDQARAQIATGRLSAGEFLPSVRQVSAELAVNPMTVSKAYSLLERDGVVELVRGQGMRIVGRPRRGAATGKRAPIEQAIRRLVKRAERARLSPEELCALVHAAFEELSHERVRPLSR